MAAETVETTKQQKFLRFRVMARIEHIILLTSFTMLAITGLPQMFAFSPISIAMIDAMGGIEQVRIIHRWMAFTLVVGSVYHVFTSAYRLFVHRERNRILLRKQDLVDMVQWVQFNLGFREHPPKMPKFNFGEKFEYWAVLWGTAVMVITGFMLWNPIATTQFLPGQFIPAAKAAHGGEAILAVASIIIWHLYNTLFKDINPSMWTGYLTREHMEEEHALELERLDAGGDPYPGIGEPPASRKRNFLITSVILGGIILGVLIWAFTFEETAITTLPPVTQEVFVPLETPAP